MKKVKLSFTIELPITDEELEYPYFAMDNDGELYLYKESPNKLKNMWDGDFIFVAALKDYWMHTKGKVEVINNE